MSIDNVTIHQGYELPNGTNTLAHDVVRLINALTSIDSDVFLRPLASSSTYVGTTAIALNRASAAQALTGITSIDGSAATLTTSRTLWGQSFNGSANVTGNLTSVGNITGSGAISLTTAAASNLSLTSGTTGVVSLDSGTTGAINIGTGANTKTITIGSSTGTVQLPTAVTKIGQTFLIQGGAVNVTFPTLAGTLVGSGDTGSVTSTMILNGTILDADVNASAAIAGTKISPDFGSQNVTTTGTSTAASFIPSSATVPTNGLYLSAANTLAFSTNSVGKLFINSIGDVNIGHTSSSYSSAGRGLLSINGSSSSILDLQTGTTSRFRIFCNGTDVEFFNTEATGVIKFGTNSAEKLRITSTGTVNIVGAGAAGSTQAVSFNGSAPVNSLVLDSSGRLGVGTASPAYALDIVGSPGVGLEIFENTSANTRRLRLTQESIGVTYDATYGSGDNTHRWLVGSIERVRIDSSGRLLAGTSTALTGSAGPYASQYSKFVALGNSSASAIGISALGYNSAGTGLANNTGIAVINFTDNAAALFAHILCETDGTTGASDYPGRLIFATTSGAAASPTERMRITSAGLVGIGLTPTYQLQLSTDSAGKPSTNTWTIVSDERIKEDIELADLDLCYEAIKTIPLKRYTWRDDVYSEEQVTDRRKLGWIAQDVETVFPKAVSIHEFKYNQVFEEVVIPSVEEEVDAEGNIITSAQPERTERGELISEDVIEDCKDLNADQIYAAMYGAIQKLIAKVETLETEVAQFKA
jgi:hypothetical protein